MFCLIFNAKIPIIFIINEYLPFILGKNYKNTSIKKLLSVED